MKHWRMMKAAKFLAMMVVGMLVFGAIVMELWNVLVPDIFHGPALTFWQALGLLLLSHILLRGWGRGDMGTDGGVTDGSIGSKKSCRRCLPKNEINLRKNGAGDAAGRPTICTPQKNNRRLEVSE